MEIHQKKSMPNYKKTLLKRSIDQKLRLRNFDARQEKIETGVVVKNRKGLSGVEGGQGICHQWKEKGQCSKGDQCSFRHESNNRAQKPEPKAPHFPSTRCHEVDVCRRKEVILVPFFDNRADTI